MRMQAHVEPPALPRTRRAEPESETTAPVRTVVHGQPPTLGIAQVTQYMGVSHTTAYGLAARGELPVPALRIGNSYRIPTAPLLELLGLTSVPAPDETSPLREGQCEDDAALAEPRQDPAETLTATGTPRVGKVVYRRAARIPVHCPRAGR